MAKGPTISQRIALEGAEEINRVLAEMGKTGDASFDQIKEAAERTTASLAKVSSQIEGIEKSVESFKAAGAKLAASIGDFGGIPNLSKAVDGLRNSFAGVVTRVTAFSAAIAGAGAGLVAFGVSAVNSVDRLQEQAQALGLTTNEYKKLEAAAVSAGATQGQVASGVARFNQQIVRGAEEQAKALLNFNKQLEQSQQRAGVINIQPGRDFAAEFRIISEEAKKLAAQLNKPFGIVQKALQDLANGGAEGRKQFAALTNRELPEIKDGLEGLRKSADGGGNALRRLGIPLLDNQGKARGFNDVLGDFAEKLKAIENPAERATIAQEAFGKGGVKLANLLAKGRDGVKEATDAIREFTDEELVDAERASSAFDALGIAAQDLKTQLGLVFAAPLARGASELAQFLEDNQERLRQFAIEIRNAVIPVVKDLFFALTGQDEQVQNKGIIQLRDNIITFGRAAREVIVNQVIPAFNALISGLDFVAQKLNSAFGTSTFSGQGLAILAIILQLTGGFRLLGSILLVAGAAFTVLANAARFFFVAVVGIARVVTLLAGSTGLGLLISALVLLATQTESGRAALKAMGVDVEALDKKIKEFLATIDKATGVSFFKGMAEDFERVKKSIGEKGLFQAIFQRDIEDLKKLKDLIVSTFDFSTHLAKAREASQQAWAAIGSAFKTLVLDPINAAFERLLQLLQKLPPPTTFSPTSAPQEDGTQPSPLFQRAGITRPGQGQTDSPNQLGNDIQDGFATASVEVQTQAQAILTQVQTFATNVVTSIQNTFSVLSTAAQSAAASLTGVFVTAGDQIALSISSAFQRAATEAQQIGTALQSSVQGMLQPLQSMIDQLGQQIDQMIQRIISNLEAAVQRAQELARLAAEAAASGGSGGAGFWRGGYTGPGGTRTPAGIVHRGEHVQPAGVVSAPGVLPFLETLRRSGGDLQGTIARFVNGFSAGGLVDGLSRSMAAMTLPGYQTGGLVAAVASSSGGRDLGTLRLQTDEGVFSVMTDDQTADALGRIVSKQQRRSGGRKPSWYK